MNRSRTYFLALLLCIFTAGCSSNFPNLQSDKEARMQAKADRKRIADSLRTERRNSKIVPAPSERPIVPGALPTIDLALWADRTFLDMDNLFSDFSRSNPPSIGPYGICSKITFTFKGKGNETKIRELICDLDQPYTPQEALQLLGLSGTRPGKISGDHVVFHPADARVIIVKCFFLEGDTVLTNRIVVEYNRKPKQEEPN